MQFDCIRLLPVPILVLITAFGRCNPNDPRNAEFNKDAKLNCTVKGSSIVGKEEENPDYCWTFAYHMKDMTEYGDWLGRKCCETAETNEDIPKDSELKEIVKIEADGM